MTRIHIRILIVLLVFFTGCLQNLAGRTIHKGSSSDAGSDAQVDMAECVPRTDEEICGDEGASCGEVSVQECGELRKPDCGGCAEPNKCGDDGEANVCGCAMLSNEAFCGANGDAECGTVSGKDPCGAPRTDDCGVCGTSEVCVSNHCDCKPDSDSAFCDMMGATCGTLTAPDNCGVMRSADCGVCNDPDVCSDNVCGCAAEPEAVTCMRLGLNCGPAMVRDNCNMLVPVNCGADCTAVGPTATCGGGGTPNVCACGTQTDQQFCQQNGATCGVVTSIDACGDTRTVSCGDCSAPDTCSGGGIANACGCTSETDAAFCLRKGYDCGTASGTDNCGLPKTNVNCGTCTGPETCGASSPQRCGCVTTVSEFCSDYDADCGQLSAVDRCDNPRSAFCGTCAAGEACDSGNNCVCDPDTDAEVCEANNACGTVTLVDNCGTSRTINCFACAAGAGQCINGQCSQCITETVAQFCAREGSQCGQTSGVNNCTGNTRFEDCGTCSNSGSGNLSCLNNLCVCVDPNPEDQCDDDACGSVTVTNECGDQVPADCGGCEDPDYVCGAQGRCKCRVLDTAEACENIECGYLDVQHCDMTVQVFCGGCPLLQGCNDQNQCVLLGG